MTSLSFSGSYRPDDVTFLLSPIQMEWTGVEEKERWIQSGEKHYSDMLSKEPEPSLTHRHFFQSALAKHRVRLASEVDLLAQQLIERHSDASAPIVLVSLVRAGVPLGVLLHRTLARLGHPSVHYGISIVRGRGIDTVALDRIEQRHGTEHLVIVDGWTGKGAIRHQVQKSFNGRKGYASTPPLVVLADPAGVADIACSYEDWLIPFGVMGASVSGLISRSVWRSAQEGYHGCVVCDHLRDKDLSQALIDTVMQVEPKLINEYRKLNSTKKAIPPSSLVHVIDSLMDRYNVKDVHRMKPGLVEATRAVMRRVPQCVLVADRNDPEAALLVDLAQAAGAPIHEVGPETLGSYRALTIIKQVI